MKITFVYRINLKKYIPKQQRIIEHKKSFITIKV